MVLEYTMVYTRSSLFVSSGESRNKVSIPGVNPQYGCFETWELGSIVWQKLSLPHLSK